MAGDLLHYQNIAQVIHSGSAVLLGNADAQKSHLAALLYFLQRELMLPVQIGNGCSYYFVRKFLRQLLYAQLILCQHVLVHKKYLLLIFG